MVFKGRDNIVKLNYTEVTSKSIDNELTERGISSIQHEITPQQEFIKFLDESILKQDDTSFCKVDPVTIKIKPNVNVYSKPYPINTELFQKFKQKIQDLLQKKIIEHSNSSVSSPAFVAVKPGGDLRILIDYRKVNEYIEDDSHYFPTIYDNIDRLSGMNYFSTLDLTNSFYQIRIKGECKYITSFITPFGQFQFNTLPFGLKSSPKIFQRILSKLLFKFNNIIIFMDDILVFDKKETEHLQSLKEILDTLTSYNLRINIEKCIFFQKSIKYLGLIVENEGYGADLTRLKEKIFEKIPRNKKELQRILGYINFFRPFVPQLSETLLPLTEMLKSNCFGNKNIIHQTVTKIKEIIKSNVKIKFPKPNEEFLLRSDSSGFACGSILSQNHGIVGIFSHKFSDTQQKYNIMEKEFLSILLSLQHFKHLIGTNKVIIYTDNKNIVTNTPINSSRLQRWKLLLAEYTYTICFIKGEDNGVADIISRLNSLRIDPIIIDEMLLNILKKQHITSDTAQKYKLKMVTLENDICAYITNERKIFIERGNAFEFLCYLHDERGHPGRECIYQTIRKYLFIPNLKRIILEICENCMLCKAVKSPRHKYGYISGNLS